MEIRFFPIKVALSLRGEVDKTIHLSALGTLARPLHTFLAADVIVVFDCLLQAVHTLPRRGQHLVLPVLDLPFYQICALRTTVDHLESKDFDHNTRLKNIL